MLEQCIFIGSKDNTAASFKLLPSPLVLGFPFSDHDQILVLNVQYHVLLQ